MKPKWMYFFYTSISLIVLNTVSQAQWSKIDTSFINAVRALTSYGSTLYAGSAGGGVFLSDDDGVTWSTHNSGLTDLRVVSLTVLDTVILAGTVDGGIYRSSNSGLSWDSSNSGVTISFVRGFTLVGSHIFTVAGKSLYRSDDRGLNWIDISLSQPGGDGITSLAVLNDDLFVGTPDSGIYRTSDLGINWMYTSTGLTNTNILVLHSNGTNLYAGTSHNANDTLGNGLFISADAGASWTPIDNDVDLYNVFSIVTYDDHVFVGTMGGGPYQFSYSSGSWVGSNVGFEGPGIFSMLVVNGDLIIGTDDGYLWRRPISQLLRIDENEPALPGEYSLGQNYPNPFNPGTYIPFNVPVRSHITISITDVLGRNVSTLVDREYPPGSYSVWWSPITLSSGVYYYTLRGEMGVVTRRLLYAK